jgi:hypothetical protein
MVEITYQMVLSTLQTAGILVGIFYYILTLKYSRKNQEQTLKTRNAMVFHQIVGQALTNKASLKYVLVIESNPNPSVEEYSELWNTDPEYRNAMYWFMQTYEILGIYLREGVVDVDIFARYQPYWNLRFWEWYKEIIYDRRRIHGSSYYRNMEYAMNALQKYFEEHPELKT